MMYNLIFSSNAEKVIKKWKKSAPVLYKKLSKMLHELMDHPKTGLGHPEALVGGNSIVYSRRIDAQHRLVYEVNDYDVTVLIVSVEGHYDDK